MGFFRLFSAFCLCLVLGFGSRAEAEPLSSFEARYDVELRGVHVASLHRIFTRKLDGSYEFQSVLQSEGLASMLKPITELESSRGVWEDEAPRPTSYAYEKHSGKKQRSARVDFNWNAGTASGQDGGKVWRATLVPGAVDKLSYQLLLMRDLARDAPLVYRIAEEGRLKSQQWVRVGNADVNLGGKVVPSVKITLAGRGGRQTTLWCAPSLNFLPVRIEYQEKNGEVTSALLRLP